MGRRKSDKSKLRERRSMGLGEKYESWVKIHEFGSSGRGTRLVSFKGKCVLHLLSDLEHYYFLIAHWNESTKFIKSQVPLLPIEKTIMIAERLNIKHPSEHNKRGCETIMSTDFLITVRGENGTDIQLARTIKPSNKLTKRVKEKFLIEENFWKEQGIDWGVVTEKEIPLILAKNLKLIYCNYFWCEKMSISQRELEELLLRFKKLYIALHEDLELLVNMFDCFC